jgi:hypothetical protein
MGIIDNTFNKINNGIFMHKLLLISSLFFFIYSGNNTIAQSSGAFESLLYARTIMSGGLGEQGVASRNAADAMQYNPAILTYTDKVSISFFRNPFNLMGWANYPLTSVNVSGNLGKGGSLGFEYTTFDMGDVPITTAEYPEGTGESLHLYERSVALGYAIPLNDNLSIGAQLRYAWMPDSFTEKLQHLLFSAGINYTPAISLNRLNIGLSFMNFGTAIKQSANLMMPDGQSVEHDYYIAPPAQINLGINGQAVTNKFFDLSLSVGVTKPIIRYDDPPDNQAQSSFNALFTDWNDCPNDMTVQIGLNYAFHPIYIGAGISFFQEMYLGYYSTGPKNIYQSFYTHGFDIGLTGRGFKAAIGYAGRWHNNNIENYLIWSFPWETFQFTLSTDMEAFGKGNFVPNNLLKGIILSGGYSFGGVIGRMNKTSYGGVDISFASNSNWSLESDFYINDNSAIISALSYSRMTETFSMPNLPYFPVLGFQRSFIFDTGIETVSLESGYRYHPIDNFHPLFLQISLGVIRMNPVVENTSPRYFYKAYDKISAGVVIPIMDSGFIVMPQIGLRTIFMEIPNTSLLGGYNQFEFGLNLGYRF